MQLVKLVLPAQAGMSPVRPFRRARTPRAPRAGGDEPTLEGSPWDDGVENLLDGESFTHNYNSGEAVTVSETAQSAPWEFTSAACVDGLGADVPSIQVDGATVTIPRGMAAASAAEAPITCTYTNTYTPRATLTLVKQMVSDGQPAPVAQPADWTLTAQGQGLVHDETVSGPGGSSEVTSQSVIAGTYRLSEMANDSQRTAGYVQDGPWSCTGATVDQNDEITLAHGQNTTCTVTNKYETGALGITKEFDDSVPAGSGGSVTFAGEYTCTLSGQPVITGTWAVDGPGEATLEPAADQIPVGAICSATEGALSGSEGLPNSSYAWGYPAVIPDVTIERDEMAQIVVTNTADRVYGGFVVTKVVPDGSTVDDGMTFTGLWDCILDDEELSGEWGRSRLVNTGRQRIPMRCRFPSGQPAWSPKRSGRISPWAVTRDTAGTEPPILGLRW